MTSTLCQSAALGRIIAPWVVKIAALFGIIVKTILSMVENVGSSLPESRVSGLAWRDMAMLVPPGLVDAAGCMLLSDLAAAAARITEVRGSIATSSCPQPNSGERPKVSNIPKARHKGRGQPHAPT